MPNLCASAFAEVRRWRGASLATGGRLWAVFRSWGPSLRRWAIDSLLPVDAWLQQQCGCLGHRYFVSG